jgi:hypothetical protein
MAKSAAIQQEFQAIQTSLEVLEPLDPVQRQFAISMILSRLQMSAPVPAMSGGAPSPLHPGATAGGAGGAAGIGGMTVKDFIKSKAPRTDLERFICLAYYLTHASETSNFSTRDITKVNTEAACQDFSNAAATATNAVNQSKFLSLAGGGKKRITTRGEALVEALPNRERVKEALAAAPRVKKRKRRKKTGKASK